MKAMIGMLMILAVMAAFCTGAATAQSVTAENMTAEAMTAEDMAAETAAAEAVAADNVVAGTAAAENMTIAAPAKQVSRFMQLSRGVPKAFESLSRNIAAGYRDVTQAADTSSVFARAPGVPIPSVKVSITKVNVIGERWVEVTNQAVGSWDLTGWKLVSAGSTTYTFPQLALNSTDSVKVHEGMGADSKTDLYAAGALWTDNMIQLQDATGRTISSYDVSTAPVQAPMWSNPLAKNIQY